MHSELLVDHALSGQRHLHTFLAILDTTHPPITRCSNPTADLGLVQRLLCPYLLYRDDLQGQPSTSLVEQNRDLSVEIEGEDLEASDKDK